MSSLPQDLFPVLPDAPMDMPKQVLERTVPEIRFPFLRNRRKSSIAPPASV